MPVLKRGISKPIKLVRDNAKPELRLNVKY